MKGLSKRPSFNRCESEPYCYFHATFLFQGVLNTVELVTGRGVCRGAVPELPAMRWRMVANSIDNDRVLACGGTNIFGDPKKNCWILGFDGKDHVLVLDLV